MTYADEVPAEVAVRWLESRAGWFPETAGGGEAPRSAWTRRTLETGEVLIKRYVPPLWKSVLRAIAGWPSRSKRAFEIGLLLERAGVRAARPLALVERRCLGVVRESEIVLRVIPGTNLRAFILSCLGPMPPGPGKEECKRSLLKAVADGIARLHGARVRQRDLKALNIIVEEMGSPEGEGSAGTLRVSFVDLEGMSRLTRPASDKIRARDLARLAVSLREEEVAEAGISPEDWNHLVASYLDEAERESGPRRQTGSGGESGARREMDPARLSAFVERTLAWARRKEARNRRRGRPTL